MSETKDGKPVPSEGAIAAELRARLRAEGIDGPPSMTRLRPAPPPRREQPAAPVPEPAPAEPADFHPPPPAVGAPAPAATFPNALPTPPALDLPVGPAPVDLPRTPAAHAPDEAPSRSRAGPLAVAVFFLTILVSILAMLLWEAFTAR